MTDWHTDPEALDEFFVAAAVTETADDIARARVRSTVFAMLRAEHGPDAIIRRPIASGWNSQVEAPADWAQGLDAVRLLREHADRLVHEWVRAARGDGMGWADLAAPLRLRVDEGDSLAEVAFEAVAPEPSMPFDSRTVAWTCGSCGKAITDHGPYGGHPVDCEHGHADDCVRHRRDIAVYQRTRG